MKKVKPLPETTRRVFLLRSLQALGTVAAAPLLSACGEPETRAPVASEVSPQQQKPAISLKVLTKDDYHILDAVTDTVIPRGGAFELGARDIDLPRRIDHYLSQGDAEVVTGVRGALQFMEHEAPKLIGTALSFSVLSFIDRSSTMQTMEASNGLPVQVFAGLKTLSLFFFYSDDASWPHIGYDGPLVGR